MSGFLSDTNILSEYNRSGGPDAGVKRWLETTDRQSQHVSVITLAEIQKGIELLAVGKRRVQLEQWLRQQLEAWFSDRILTSRPPGGRSLGIAAGTGSTSRAASAHGRFIDRGDRASL